MEILSSISHNFSRLFLVYRLLCCRIRDGHLGIVMGGGGGGKKKKIMQGKVMGKKKKKKGGAQKKR